MSIGLVLTGGTVATRAGTILDVEHGDVIDLRDPTPAWVRAALTAGWGSAPEIDARQPVSLLSENMQPSLWPLIAAAVRDVVTAGADGVVVLHGTDTAAYTAAALSYLLSDLDVAVVLTGSNLPPDAVGSDAATNVRDAATAARDLPAGVYLSFAGSPDATSTVHLGTQVRKVRAGGAAFVSVNRLAVARVADGILEPIAVPVVDARVPGAASFDAAVLRVTCHPGAAFDLLADAAVAGARGVVVELYPCATGPVGGHDGLDAFVRRLRASGIAVVGVIGQQPPDSLSTYATSQALEDAGLTFVRGLTPEAATVKLMWLLAQTTALDEVQQLIAEPLAGDIPDVLVAAGRVEE